jgi:hypothetical protein
MLRNVIYCIRREFQPLRIFPLQNIYLLYRHAVRAPLSFRGLLLASAAQRVFALKEAQVP